MLAVRAYNMPVPGLKLHKRLESLVKGHIFWTAVCEWELNTKVTGRTQIAKRQYRQLCARENSNERYSMDMEMVRDKRRKENRMRANAQMWSILKRFENVFMQVGEMKQWVTT